MTKITFTKMHGLGNDFMVIDAINQSINLSSQTIQSLADRHTGVGFDQLLLIEKSPDDNHDFYYRIYNADGNEVEQCGNGARCFARFVADKGLCDKKIISVLTKDGSLQLHLVDHDQIKVDMGAPRFQPNEIPLVWPKQQLSYSVELDGETLHFAAVSMGNPHCVLQVTDITEARVNHIGQALTNHPLFPQGVNVGFAQIKSRDKILLRVYERGVGETQACGTGACAAVVSGQRWGLLDENAAVHLPGGVLDVNWQGNDSTVWMTGPAETVYEATIVA